MVSGNTTLNNSNNDVNTIAAENGGTTSFEDSDGYTVGTVSVDGMSVTGFPAPEIDFQGNVLFGPTLTGTSVTRTYTIENTGDAPMELIGAPVTVSGPNMDEFAIVSQPTGPIGVGQNVTFDVVFTPTTAGLRTATLSIGNNSDVNPLVFNVQGTGTSSLINEKFDGPTTQLTTGNGFSLGAGVFQSNPATQYASSTLSPAIGLPASGVTITTEVTTTASSSTQFSNAYLVFDYVNATNYKLAGVETKNQLWVISQVSGSTYSRLASVADSSITAAATRNLRLQLTSAGATLVTETSGVADVSLAGSGFLTRNVGVGTVSASSQFDCFVIDPISTSPEINVQGNGATIANNSTVPSTSNGTNFGSTTTTGNITRTFTIQNTGGEALTLTGAPVTISGTNAADFSIVAQPSSSIAAGSSATFDINFTPGALGTRTASVSIANNDSDENPYNFAIQGTGSTEPTETKIVNENFESTPIELATNTGFTIVTRGNGNKVFQSPAGTRNASSTVTPAISPSTNQVRIMTNVALTTANETRFSNGYLVFDYVDANNFKVAGVEGKNKVWTIAQVSGSNYSKLVEVVDSQITETDNYDLDLLLTSTGATLTTRDGIGNLSIDGNFLGQNVGVGAVMALSQFDNFMVIELPNS